MRARRNTVWTPRHQLIAEVAAACGVSLGEIGRTLGVTGQTVVCHLDPRAAERARVSARQRITADPERNREQVREWNHENPERRRQASRYRKRLRLGWSMEEALGTVPRQRPERPK